MVSEGNRGTARDGSEVGVIRSALVGDSRSLGPLAERLTFIPRVLRAMNRRSGAPLPDGDLEDAAQEAVLAVWRKIRIFDGSVRLESWLYRFAQIEYLRARRTRARHSIAEVSASDATSAQSGADAKDWDLEALQKGLEELPEHERMDIPMNTAKSRYYRALRALRTRLSPRQRPLSGSRAG
jgi:RNA polymerase sigma factor (sigma-70 family)